MSGVTAPQPTGDGSLQVVETPEEIAYELRASEGAIWIGSRLLLGILAFAFASLGFAYFYLRSMNNANLWRPHGVTASVSFGVAILVISLVASGLSVYGSWRRRTGRVLDSTVAGWMTLAAGGLAAGVQMWELFELRFYPGSSGYASCFIGWAVLNIALLLSGAYWSESMLVRSLRIRRASRTEGLPVSESVAAEAEAAAYPLSDRVADIEAVAANHHWVFIGLVNLIFFLMFYVM